jgi:Eco29kI restriction endonuclease
VQRTASIHHYAGLNPFAIGHCYTPGPINSAREARARLTLQTDSKRPESFAQGARLCGRLTDHRKNIGKAAASLELADFEFRSLVVQSGWETAAEDYLIHLFRPIWNSETNILYGLGKHGDSATTRANRRSPWDTLHPGRAWAADSIEDAKSVAQINTELAKHFADLPAYTDLESVLTSFIEELRQG